MKIRLKHVQDWTDKKTGKRYCFLRRPGHDRVRLPGVPGSAEFLTGYYAALAGHAPAAAVGVAQKVAAALGGAMQRYIDGALAKRVKGDTFKRQKSTLLGTVKVAGDDTPVSMFNVDYVKRTIRDANTPGIAKTWLLTVREFCKWAVEEKLMDADPTAGIVVKLPKSEGHDTFSEAQIAQFEARWPIGTRERLLFSLLLHTGQRCSDVRLLGPTSIVKGAFPIKQRKTGAEVCIPVHPELAKAIAACNVVGLGFFLTTRTGKPLDQRDLNKWFRRACDEAGLPDTCVPHGLRKACCRRLAEAGASVKLIAAVSGHTTLKEIERYTKAMDNEKGARDAFALLTAKGGA